MTRFGRLRWTPRTAVLAMVGAVAIYGSNFVVSRFGTLHGLTAEDLAALRLGVAAPLLLPLFLRRGLATCAGIGWGKGLALALTSGAPVALLMNAGLSLAPAAHGATIGPGTVTTVGAIYGIVLARALPPRLTLAGLALVLCGLAAMGVAGSTNPSPSVALGDLCFLAMGLLWGCYPILIGRWRIDAMTGAAVCTVLSLPYVAVYLLLGRSNLAAAPLGLVLAQAAWQGLVATVLGLWLWGAAVRVIGAPRTQLFPPAIPVIGTSLAIPVLGEWPAPVQAAGLVAIVGGLGLLALSALLAARRAGPAA